MKMAGVKNRDVCCTRKREGKNSANGDKEILIADGAVRKVQDTRGKVKMKDRWWINVRR